jgi:4-hydroxy-tetrahydrodipicolinate synthase
MFEGLSVAIVTPFRNGAVDEEAFRGLVGRLLEQGVDGLIPAGSTGEAATMTRDERRLVIRAAVEEAKGKAFVVAGTGTNNTAQSIEYSMDAREAGADGVMVVTPYYNKPTPAGLVAHFKAISAAVKLPILAYNVPGRTGYNLLPAVASQLAAVPGVVALKEASGSVDQVMDTMAAAPALTLLSGDDSLTLPLVAIGARGIVSVSGHVVGRELKGVLEACAKGDLDAARRHHARLLPITRALFVESNPGPVKYALSRLGWIANELRAPLAPVTAETAARVDQELRALGLIS